MTKTSIDTIDLSDVRALQNLLDRLPQGQAARTLAKALGVWNGNNHDGAGAKTRTYPSSYSNLTNHELSDTYALWCSEVGRATELVGLLEGVRKFVDLLSKQHKAAARARLRREAEEEASKAEAEKRRYTKPTATQIADLAEEDEKVRQTEEVMALLAITIPSAAAFKEAALATTAGLSREISFRQAELGARIRA